MKNIFPVIIIAALMAVSCTEEIDLKLGDTYTRLIVDGYISTDTVKQRVKLLKTSNYFDTASPEPIHNALVTISDGTTIYNFTESPTEEGVYQTDTAVAGIVGKTYSLTIKDIDIDGDGEKEIFTSESRMEPTIKADSLAIEFDSFVMGKDTLDKSWVILLYCFEPNPAGQAYMFNIYKNGVLLSDTLYEKGITDDFAINNQYINGAAVGSLGSRNPQEIVHKGDTITIEIAGIPLEYNNYYFQFMSQFRGTVPMFGGPPANIITNIKPKDKAVGYFYTRSNSRSSIIASGVYEKYEQ